MDRSLPWRSDVATYLLHILLISALSLVAVGLIYCTKTGGFWIQFQAGPMVRNNFMAQLLFDGILKVSIVNAIGLLPHSLYIRRIQTARLAESFGYIVMDVLSRELLFLGISLMIWLCFVPFGAFTGDANLAIRALLPTFVAAGYFRNLTGVYVYAVAVSSLPLFAAVLARLLSTFAIGRRFVTSLFFWLPWTEKPLRSLSLVAAALMMFFGYLGSALIAPFAGYS